MKDTLAECFDTRDYRAKKRLIDFILNEGEIPDEHSFTKTKVNNEVFCKYTMRVKVIK